jgi:hypothetical protein
MEQRKSKKVRFFEADPSEQIGLFKTAEYAAPGTLVNQSREHMFQNTTMNERLHPVTRSNDVASPGILPGFVPNNIRDNCFIKEVENREHVNPFTPVNMISKNIGNYYFFDTRFNKKSYN